MKRLLLAIAVAALIAALMAPAAQAQGNWHWCWNSSLGIWDHCWWEGGGVSQEADQSSHAGEITQLSLLAIREEEAGAATLRPLPHCVQGSILDSPPWPRSGLAQ